MLVRNVTRVRHIQKIAWCENGTHHGDIEQKAQFPNVNTPPIPIIK